jgi:hypothetical protein
MAKKKVKKYHQGGSHEDHHTQAVPAPRQNPVGGPGGLPVDRNRPKSRLAEERILNRANQKKASMVPATPAKPRQRPTNPFMPATRAQPITVGGPKQVQPMPAPQRPTAVGVTPQPLQQVAPPLLQLPSRRRKLAQPTSFRRPTRDQLIDTFGRMINENERQGRTASRVNPNAVLGRPKPRRRR